MTSESFARDSLKSCKKDNLLKLTTLPIEEADIIMSMVYGSEFETLV